jgi:hypothetical protein
MERFPVKDSSFAAGTVFKREDAEGGQGGAEISANIEEECF